MKQIFLFLTALLFACCSSDIEMKAETTSANHGKTLVAYYSYTGNCRSIVTELTNQIEADVVEITPVDKSQKYEENGYAIGTALLNAIKANPNDASSYPAIDPVTVSLSDYQNIIVVTPLWWSQMAAIMQTYLFGAGSQMAGKSFSMIVSSASSGISGVVSDAKRLVPEASWMGARGIMDGRCIVDQQLEPQKHRLAYRGMAQDIEFYRRTNYYEQNVYHHRWKIAERDSRR